MNYLEKFMIGMAYDNETMRVNLLVKVNDVEFNLGPTNARAYAKLLNDAADHAELIQRRGRENLMEELNSGYENGN